MRAQRCFLGAVLYELLTGVPFRGETMAELLRRIREEEPALPRRQDPAIPRGVFRTSA